MYKLNREHVKEVFKTYTDAYDSKDPKIALKIEHTYYVAENADRIAKGIGLSEEDCDLAWLLGMLHDIGRFEQVRRYGTFVDAKSIAHALMSCEVLFPEAYDVDEKFFQEMPCGRFGKIQDYLKESDGQDQASLVGKNPFDDEIPEDWLHLIRLSISLHSAFRLPEDLTEREALFCNILRDADKIDIFRVNRQTPMEDIIDCTEEEIHTSEVTQDVEDAIREHRVVKRTPNYIMNPANHVVAHCCLAFELVFEESWKITKAQGYLKEMLEFRNENEHTNRTMEWLNEELLGFWKDRM